MIRSIFDEAEEEKPEREIKIEEVEPKKEIENINLPETESEKSISPATQSAELNLPETPDAGANPPETFIESRDFAETELLEPQFESALLPEEQPEEQIEKINLPESEIENVELSDEQIEQLTAQIVSLNLQDTDELPEVPDSREPETFVEPEAAPVENKPEIEAQPAIVVETAPQTQTAAQIEFNPETNYLSASPPMPQAQEKPGYKPESPVETIRKSGLAYAAAVVLFGSIVFMLVLGWFFDLLTGSSPWGMVGGIVVGSIIGFYQFFKLTSEILKNKD